MEDRPRRVGFRILSSVLNSSEITQRTGIQPTTVGEMGQSLTPGIAGGPTRQETVWVVDSPLGQEASLPERLEALLGVVERHIPTLAGLSGTCLMHFFVGHEALATATGPVVLERALLRRLVAVPGGGLLFETNQP